MGGNGIRGGTRGVGGNGIRGGARGVGGNGIRGGARGVGGNGIRELTEGDVENGSAYILHVVIAQRKLRTVIFERLCRECTLTAI